MSFSSSKLAAGVGSAIVRVLLRKKSDGEPLPGLAWDTADLKITMNNQLDGIGSVSLIGFVTGPGGSVQDIASPGTFVSPTDSDHIRFKEMHPFVFAGVYEFQIHDFVSSVPGKIDLYLWDSGGSLDLEMHHHHIEVEVPAVALQTQMAGLATASNLATANAGIAAIHTIVGTSGVIVHASAKTGYSLSATQTFSLTGNITGNLSGSVGSVTSMVTANVIQISGDATAADNLEAILDGTGGVTLSIKNLVINNGGEASVPGISITTSGDDSPGFLINSTQNPAIRWASIGASAISLDSDQGASQVFPALENVWLAAMESEYASGQGPLTAAMALRAILAVCAGQSSGANGGAATVTFKVPIGATARVTADVDQFGNRSNVVLNP